MCNLKHAHVVCRCRMETRERAASTDCSSRYRPWLPFHARKVLSFQPPDRARRASRWPSPADVALSDGMPSRAALRRHNRRPALRWAWPPACLRARGSLCWGARLQSRVFVEAEEDRDTGVVRPQRYSTVSLLAVGRLIDVGALGGRRVVGEQLHRNDVEDRRHLGRDLRQCDDGGGLAAQARRARAVAQPRQLGTAPWPARNRTPSRRR